MDYSNLKDKTIFDLCDDEDILDDIAIVSKEEYLADIKSNPLANIFDMQDLAEMTEDKELMKAIKIQFKKELADASK